MSCTGTLLILANMAFGLTGVCLDLFKTHFILPKNKRAREAPLNRKNIKSMVRIKDINQDGLQKTGLNAFPDIKQLHRLGCRSQLSPNTRCFLGLQQLRLPKTTHTTPVASISPPKHKLTWVFIYPSLTGLTNHFIQRVPNFFP